MKKKILVVLVAAGLLAAVGGVAMSASAAPSQAEPTTTAPETPTTLSETVIYGSGPSGDLDFSIPDCPVNTYAAEAANTFSCQPTSAPVPQGTEEIPADGSTCSVPVGEDLEFLPSGEVRYTQSAQMKDLLACLIPNIPGWLEYEYGGNTPPPEWASESQSLAPNHFVWVPSANSTTFDMSQTCDSDDPLNIFYYCPQDGNIFFGEDKAWQIYHGDEHRAAGGDSAIESAMAHEIGHRIQQVANAHAVSRENPRAQIPRENQADCFSGAMMAYVGRLGLLDVSETLDTNPEGTFVERSGGDDMYDMLAGILGVSEPEHLGRTHGTIDQRFRAFFVGYDAPVSQGAWDCDFYLTDISIIPADDEDATTSTAAVTAANVTASGATGDTAPITPVPAPAATMGLPTGSTNPLDDGLAKACLDGDMNSCDDLYDRTVDDNGVVPGLETYSVFSDTCAGRQPEGTGLLCQDVFISTSGAATATTVTVAPAAPTTVTVAPTTAPVTTVTVAPAAPTTTGPAAAALADPAPVPAGPNALQTITTECADWVLASFHAEAEVAGAVDDPGHLAEKAAAAGQTLDEFILAYINQMLSTSTESGTTRLITGDPWDGADGQGDPPTEYGFVQGKMLTCMVVATQMPDDLFQHYLDTTDSEAVWDGYRLRWFFTDPDENGDKVFIVGLEVQAA